MELFGVISKTWEMYSDKNVKNIKLNFELRVAQIIVFVALASLL